MNLNSWKTAQTFVISFSEMFTGTSMKMATMNNCTISKLMTMNLLKNMKMKFIHHESLCFSVHS